MSSVHLQLKHFGLVSSAETRDPRIMDHMQFAIRLFIVEVVQLARSWVRRSLDPQGSGFESRLLQHRQVFLSIFDKAAVFTRSDSVPSHTQGWSSSPVVLVVAVEPGLRGVTQPRHLILHAPSSLQSGRCDLRERIHCRDCHPSSSESTPSFYPRCHAGLPMAD